MVRFTASVVSLLFVASMGLGSPIESAVHLKWEEEKGFSMGSGTVIATADGKSLILSAAHVVPNAGTKITVTHNEKEYVGSYLAGSKVTEVPLPNGLHTITIEGPDLALVVVEAELPVVELAAKPLKVGDAVTQHGFSGGRIKNGPFSKMGKVTDDAADNLWSTADSRRGDSGCGLFNADGKLAGVVHSRSVDQDEPGGLATGLIEVKDFLKAKVKGFDDFKKTLK